MKQALFLIFLLAVAPFLAFSQTKNGDAKALRELKRIDDEFHTAFRTADAAMLHLLLTDILFGHIRPEKSKLSRNCSPLLSPAN